MVECRIGEMPRKVLIIERCRQTGTSVGHSDCDLLRGTMAAGFMLMSLELCRIRTSSEQQLSLMFQSPGKH
jgi:hypothetical protein